MPHNVLFLGFHSKHELWPFPPFIGALWQRYISLWSEGGSLGNSLSSSLTGNPLHSGGLGELAENGLDSVTSSRQAGSVSAPYLLHRSTVSNNAATEVETTEIKTASIIEGT